MRRLVLSLVLVILAAVGSQAQGVKIIALPAPPAAAAAVSPNFSINNLPTNLPNMRKCLSAADQGGGTPCTVLVMGTSLTLPSLKSGAYTGFDSWVWQMAAILNGYNLGTISNNSTHYVDVSANGAVGDGIAGQPRHLTMPNVYTNFGANWQQDCSATYLGGCLLLNTAVAGSGNVTIVPGEPVDHCTVWGLVLPAGVAAGFAKMSAKLGTGSAGTLDENNAAYEGWGSVTVASTLTQQNLVITNVAGANGSGFMYVAAWYCWNSTKPSIVFLNAGVGGWDSVNFAFTGNDPLNPYQLINDTPLHGRAGINPAMCILELITNDASSGVAFATYAANLKLLAAACQAGGGDVVFTTTTHSNDVFGHTDAVYAPYLNVYKQTAASIAQGMGSVPVWDYYSTTNVATEIANGWLDSDFIHPTVQGQADWARFQALQFAAPLGLH